MGRIIQRARRFLQGLSWRNLFSGGSRQVADAEMRIGTKRKHALSPEKHAELQRLCEQLFKKKSLVTSGKLQFIGLDNIKKRLGKQWAGLSEIVYGIAEDAMRKHLEQGDFFLRYKDNTYIIIFAHPSVEQGQQKATAIASEIRDQLFALDEADLKSLEVREAIKQISMNFSASAGVGDFLDMLTGDWQEEPETEDAPDIVFTDAGDTQDEGEIAPLMVETSAKRATNASLSRNIDIAELACHYQPLWDVPRNALTTYLCLLHAQNESGEAPAMEVHRGLYQGQSTQRILSLDLSILQRVMAELGDMEKDGRKFLIACPVHYQTLGSFEIYEAYKAKLQNVPEAQRQYLVLYVMGAPYIATTKDPYWFGVPLQQFCRQVILELPLRRDINFSLVKSSGIKAVAVSLEKNTLDEQETLKLLNSFAGRAAAVKIGTSAVTGLSTLSLTTSAVGAGFELLGGRAIHEMVKRPDAVHRYRHEDLLKGLTSKAS